MSAASPDEPVYRGAPRGLDPPTGAHVGRPASLAVALLFAALGLVDLIVRLAAP